MDDEPGIQRLFTAVESFQRVVVTESRGLEHCSAPCEDRWLAGGCRQPRRVIGSIQRGHQCVELFGLHGRYQLLAQDLFDPLHRSFPYELRRLLVDKVGGVLDAVQGRLLRAKLDAFRFDCHGDISFFFPRSLLLG